VIFIFLTVTKSIYFIRFSINIHIENLFPNYEDKIFQRFLIVFENQRLLDKGSIVKIYILLKLK
jgi:hypothetical protein